MRLLGPDSRPIDLSRWGRAHALPFAPLDEVLKRVPPEPDWIWKGHIARGTLTLLAGQPKVGKSTLVFALLAALRTGKTLLDQPTRSAKVVMLTEEGYHTVAEKARKMGAWSHLHVLFRHQAHGRAWGEVVDEAIRYAESIGAKLLVIDTFAEWAKLGGDAENDAGTILEALRPLGQAASRDLAILLVTHQRKSSGKHATAVRGSSALTGAVDVIIELEHPKGKSLPSGVRVLKCESRFSSTPSERTVIMDNFDYSVCAGSSETAAAEAARLISALLEHGKGSAVSLASSVDRPPSTVRKRLEILREAGRVSRSGNGVRGNPYIYQPAEILSTHIELYSAETNPRDDRSTPFMVGRSCPPGTKSAIITART